MVRWSLNKCLPNKLVYAFNLVWAAAGSKQRGLTVFDLVSERNRKPEAGLISSNLQILKYISRPRTGQTDLLELRLNAKTFTSPDLKDFVQIWLNKNPESSGKRKISYILTCSRSATRSSAKNKALKRAWSFAWIKTCNALRTELFRNIFSR